MPQTAVATSSEAPTTLDQLLDRGRVQGHLSLAELRHAFAEAGISPAEGRSILRELTEAGVSLAAENEPALARRHEAKPAAKTTAPRRPSRKTKAAEPRRRPTAEGRDATKHDQRTPDTEASDEEWTPGRRREAEPTIDLDDQSSVMGDSVHTYLKSIGRRTLLTAAQEVELAKRIEAGLYAESKLETEPGLSAAARDDLEWVAEDGRRAKDHMLEANLRLVVSVAKKYTDRGMALLDVVQEGNLGLIRAVEKFDYTKGYKFSTYAMWWIRQAIQRGFADSARTIRLPVHVLEMLSKLSRVERDMHQRLGREPTPEELAVELDKTPDQIEELLRTSRQPISLNATIGEDGETTIGDLIEDVDSPEASEVVDRQLLAEQLRGVLGNLSPARGQDHGPALRPGRRQAAHPRRDRQAPRPDPRAHPPAGEGVAVQAAPPQQHPPAARLGELTRGSEEARHRVRVPGLAVSPGPGFERRGWEPDAGRARIPGDAVLLAQRAQAVDLGGPPGALGVSPGPCGGGCGRRTTSPRTWPAGSPRRPQRLGQRPVERQARGAQLLGRQSAARTRRNSCSAAAPSPAARGSSCRPPGQRGNGPPPPGSHAVGKTPSSAPLAFAGPSRRPGLRLSATPPVLGPSVRRALYTVRSGGRMLPMPAKRPPIPLSRERIIDAALHIADAQGLRRLTMRRLGDALQVEAMAIYHHLPRGKDALMDALAEHVTTVHVEPGASWQDSARAWCRASRAALREHPGVLALALTKPPRGARRSPSGSRPTSWPRRGWRRAGGRAGAAGLRLRRVAVEVQQSGWAEPRCRRAWPRRDGARGRHRLRTRPDRPCSKG